MAQDPQGTSEDFYTLAQLRRQYTDWGGAKHDEIEEARQARHYYHGDQWSPEEIKTLRKRKQPVVTFNRINRKIDGVVGVVQRLRQDPKAFPRTPRQEEGAELGTAALRYALDRARWESLEAEGVRDAAIEGMAVCELGLDQGDHGDPEITLSIVDPDLFFYDPRSFREDFSDARYMGVAKWLDLEAAQELYPDHADALSGLISSGGDIETTAQADRERRWIDTEQKRVRIIEHWYIKRSAWRFCHYASGLELAKGTSPFTDERGKTMPRYLAFSAFVDHDGDRYGLVRHLKSPQDEINARRSKALHLLNTRRVIADEGAVTDVEKARAELAKPDGYVEVLPGEGEVRKRFTVEDGISQAQMAGQFEMLAEAKAEIETFGPNPAVLGQETSAKSGRAIALLQQAGISELGPFLRSYRDWKLRVYRAVWSAVQSHWTAERWIRVTDDEGLAQFIQVNGLDLDEAGRPVLVNALGSLDVDVVLDEGPDSVTTMADTFDLLGSLAAAGVPVPPQVVIELSALPASTKKRINTMLEGAKGQDPLAGRAREAEIGKTESEAARNKALALNYAAETSERLAGMAFSSPRPFAGDENGPDEEGPELRP